LSHKLRLVEVRHTRSITWHTIRRELVA